MKKKFVKFLSVILCATMLTACGAPAADKSTNTAADAGTAEQKSGAPTADKSTDTAAGAGTVEPKKCTIGVAFYQDGGPAPTGTKAFLEEAGKLLNCEFKYTVLTQTDEAANLTKIQELIASNVDGIICTMDMGRCRQLSMSVRLPVFILAVILPTMIHLIHRTMIKYSKILTS